MGNLTIGKSEFESLMQRIADGWNEGDARQAADCFCEDADGPRDGGCGVRRAA